MSEVDWEARSVEWQRKWSVERAEVVRLREALRQIAYADWPHDPEAVGPEHAIQRLALRVLDKTDDAP